MKDQRYEAIKHYARKKKEFTIEDLSRQLNVSVTTIRRDVTALAKEGLLCKRYGRILWSGDEMPPVQEEILSQPSRDSSATREEELRMARAAANLIEDNDCIYIESGSFCFPSLIKLIDKDNVTAVTSDLQIALCLLKNERLNTIVLGGYVWRGSYLLYGDITERALAGMHFHKYFTLPGSISESGDVMYFDAHTSSLRNALRQISEKTVLIAPKDRMGRTAFLKIGSLNDCSVIITNSSPEELPIPGDESTQVISVAEQEPPHSSPSL